MHLSPLASNGTDTTRWRRKTVGEIVNKFVDRCQEEYAG
jgi:hypothetical protein